MVMAIIHSYVSSLNLIIVRFSGQVDFRQIARYLEDLVAMDEFSIELNMVTIFEEKVDLSSLNSDKVMNIPELLPRFSSHTHQIMVASEMLPYGLSRMFVTYAQGESEDSVQLKLVNSLPEACQLLGITEEQFLLGEAQSDPNLGQQNPR